MSKFDDIILKNLISQTGDVIHEQEQAPPVDPAMDPAAAADPAMDPAAAAPPIEPPVPESPDEPAIKVNMLDLARKALLVNPDTIDQGAKGILANVVTPENSDKIEEIISGIVTIESDVDTGGANIEYSKNL